MKHPASTTQSAAGLPGWYRTMLVAASTLILCSCKGPAAAPPPGGVQASLPSAAWTGHPGDGYTQPGPPSPHLAPGVAWDASIAGRGGAIPGPDGLPIPVHTHFGLTPQMTAQWAPPGIARPWPDDEYISDGGDRYPGTKIGPDWTIYGLAVEDTIVHYDTLDGRVEVEPSNRVPIYAPRFAAVRHIANLQQHAQVDLMRGMHHPLAAESEMELMPPAVNVLPEQPIGHLGIRQTTTMRMRDEDLEVSSAVDADGLDNVYEFHEDFAVIHWSQYDELQRAALVEWFDAAIAWTQDVGVGVVVDSFEAGEVVGDRQAEAIFTFDELPDRTRIRVVKGASKQAARPGEIIDFIIRFDNVGNRTVGNVTVLDNLSGRLEFVPGSDEATVESEFFAQPNEAGSLVLRWEITEPVEPGHGGMVRFRCRVR